MIQLVKLDFFDTWNGDSRYAILIGGDLEKENVEVQVYNRYSKTERKMVMNSRNVKKINFSDLPEWEREYYVEKYI